MNKDLKFGFNPFSLVRAGQLPGMVLSLAMAMLFLLYGGPMAAGEDGCLDKNREREERYAAAMEEIARLWEPLYSYIDNKESPADNEMLLAKQKNIWRQVAELAFKVANDFPECASGYCLVDPSSAWQEAMTAVSMMSGTDEEWSKTVESIKTDEARLKALGYQGGFDWDKLAYNLYDDMDREEYDCGELTAFRRTALGRALEAGAIHFQQLREAGLEDGQDTNDDLKSNILFRLEIISDLLKAEADGDNWPDLMREAEAILEQLTQLDPLSSAQRRLDTYELLLESKISDEQWLALIEKTEKTLEELALIDPKAIEQREVTPESLANARKIFINGTPFEESGFAELARNWPRGQELPLSAIPEENELITRLSKISFWGDGEHRLFDDLLKLNYALYFEKAQNFAEEKLGMERLKATYAWAQTRSSCAYPNWLLVWIDELIYDCDWPKSDNINARLAYIELMENALAAAMMEYTYDRREILKSWRNFLESRKADAATDIEGQHIQKCLNRLAQLAEEKISHRPILSASLESRDHFAYGRRIICPPLSSVHFKANFLAEHIYFGFDDYQIPPKMEDALQFKVAFFMQFPSITAEIQGHCDNAGSIKYNQALGYLRAKAVYDYLVSSGIDASRLSIASYGSRRPLEAAFTKEARARNRRVQFVITGD